MLPGTHEDFLNCDEQVTPRSENLRKRLLMKLRSKPSFTLSASSWNTQFEQALEVQ